MQMCLEDSFEIPHYGIVDYGFIDADCFYYFRIGLYQKATCEDK